jgi:NADH-quinone oxidoreductase subunit N
MINPESLLLMRHEILLTLITLIILMAEIAGMGKNRLINLTIVLFFIVLVIGFFPVAEGSLFGDMYRSGRMTSLMKNILNIGVMILIFQTAGWIKRPEYEGRVSEFYLLILSTLIGMNFMISSGHFLMFYIGLELATIPIAALAAYDHFKAISSEAGIKLILSSALSSGILLYGLSMIYGTTGSLYFSDISGVALNTPLQIMAFIFFFAGMGFKISLVPFHLWTADVYEGSPVNVASYLSVISKGAAAFILTIILFTVFHSIAVIWKELVYAIAVITMTIGNLFAIRQKNMKRFLAFSSIAQAGFILLGIIDGTSLGMSTVMYFVLVYIFSNLGAFGVISAISVITGKENMDDYNGLYKTNPKLSLVMMLALFSLAGIPPVAGFFGKFFLFAAAAHQGYYWLVFIAVLNATISLYYYLLVVKAMFINKNDTPIGYFKSDLTTRTGLLLCVAGIFFIGFLSPIYEFIKMLSIGM